MTLGLLPELPLRRFSYAGNSSLAGASAVLLNHQARQQAVAISDRITSIDLGAVPGYMEHYTAALFFPHTEGQKLFPVTWRRLYG